MREEERRGKEEDESERKARQMNRKRARSGNVKSGRLKIEVKNRNRIDFVKVIMMKKCTENARQSTDDFFSEYNALALKE